VKWAGGLLLVRNTILSLFVYGVVVKNRSGDIEENECHHPVRFEDARQVVVANHIPEHPRPKYDEWQDDNQRQ
jgi:hypothetical protein